MKFVKQHPLSTCSGMQPGHIPCGHGGPLQTTTPSFGSDHICGAPAPPVLFGVGAGSDQLGRNRTVHSNTEKKIEMLELKMCFNR